MTTLLKNLLGNGSKDREASEEMREILQEMQHERGRCEALLNSVHGAAERLDQIAEPLAKAGSDVNAVGERLAEIEQRFTAALQISSQLDDRSQSMTEGQQRAETQVAKTLEEVQQVRAVFEELSGKVDVAMDLKDRLVAFLEVEKPFQQAKGEVDSLRSQVDGTSEHMTRLREQHDRLMDAHKLAMSKMEALDRRRDDLGRSLSDKERRVATVEQAVKGVDDIQRTVSEIKREIGSLKALGDSVVQKTAALEAQRDAVEKAIAQADHLDQSMRQIDAGLRQQQDNERALGALQDQVVTLRSLHETVIERSSEISQLQNTTEEQVGAARQDLTSMTDEMRKTVERFDFEARGLESVSQRVADLRGSLGDAENRFKGLNESSQTAGELKTQTKSLAVQLQGLTQEVGQVQQDMEKFLNIRRDVDETGQTVREVHAGLTRIEEMRPGLESALRDLEHLNGAQAIVKDALEQTQVAHEEIARVRTSQAETRSWLAGMEKSIASLRDQVGEVQKLTPTIEVTHQQALRLGDAMAAIESRTQFVENLQRRMTDLEALGGRLDERGQKLHAQMEGAEQKFLGLAASAQEAERLTQSVAGVSSRLIESERKAEGIQKAVAATAQRCESVEELAEQTRALKPELDQRQHALKEATKDLQRASALRKDAATAAQQLEELAKRLLAALTTADKRTAEVDELATQLEDRATRLRSVEKRLGQFEERMTKWEPLGKEIARSLEQISARQGTVEALQADLDRMSALAEKTSADVREITAARQEIEQGHALLVDVMTKMDEMRDTASALEERKRQMTKAEERLARADALLVEVGSSLEALQGQKALVEQAVEKAGSLQFLLKQAEATIDGLREEREMSSRVRTAMAVVREDDEDDHEQGLKKAA
jgi:chromosome segregation ATPase